MKKISLHKFQVYKGKRSILDIPEVIFYSKNKYLIKGKSGSGKSTLLKSILFFEYFSGKIMMDDKQVINNFDIFNYRQNFSYISQDVAHFRGSVGDFLKIPFKFKSNSHLRYDHEKIKCYITSFNMQFSILEQNFNSLSGGEKQRLVLIQSLLLGRKWFILDEITFGLDDINKKIVVKEVCQKELTAIIVSHDSIWDKYVDHKFSLHNTHLLPT